MSEQIKRLDAHASHLLNGLLDLRAKYAMLRPMLFDKSVQETVQGNRAQGFLILRHALFLSCAQDVAKLGMDADRRSPSVEKIVAALTDDSLRAQLRDMFAQRAPTVWSGDEGGENSGIRPALAAMDAREEEERRAQHDALCADLSNQWAALAATPAFQAFRVIRDKVSAHMEIRLVNDRYEAQDIEELGIKWSDLGSTIDAMEQVLELIGLTVRSCNFAWNGYHLQMDRAAAAFWNVEVIAGNQRDQPV